MTHNLQRRIYCDNAATSFPKPPTVLAAMVDYAQNIGASAGRGAYAEARRSAEVIRNCRQRLNTLFNGENPDHVIFTLNCSDSLNMVIHGLLQPGDHAICIAMDHNSILRPLNELSGRGLITQTRVAAQPGSGVVDPDDIRAAITRHTRLIAIGHASNVTGTVQNIREIGRIARQAAVPFLVDAAQSAGHLPIDIASDCIDFLACPGHKGLLGPLGTGVLYIRPGMEQCLRTIREGGTGSVSERDTQPEFMPDRFESGSHNAIGIAGLAAGVEWILARGIKTIAAHERKICETFTAMVCGIDGLEYYGPQDGTGRVGVFSVRIAGMDTLQLATQLEEEYGILTRPGLHCAPAAHHTIGTDQPAVPGGMAGTTRLSFGPFNTLEDVQTSAKALIQIATRSSNTQNRDTEKLVHTGR
ncbi:MAG: aminotransferase class V-fold PLP-dependent enzyme [Planctomycetes bacterium]|jgi:cysteine desulfurase family protein|nr:aminotransferase class V-fold PLP-dependent enzyme [Planctomycetota bacterium]